MIRDVMELVKAFAPKKAKRRAALAEGVLLQFIRLAYRQIPSTSGMAPLWRVDITDEMMSNLRMWERAHAAGFKGAAVNVLKGWPS